MMQTQYDVYLEFGKKRTFAGSLDWPGWCRQGRNEDEALAALLDYGARYASILKGTRSGFVAPKALSQLNVGERLPGNVTTDFGAPAIPPTVDQDRSCDEATLKRFETILRAGWRAFDETVRAARGKRLATGPRGGGRSLDEIVEHVIGAEAGYLTAVGWKSPRAASHAAQLDANREAVLEALKVSAAGQIPERGPRGGVRWSARYFVRRTAWHVIAHVWEIQRRVST